MTKITILRWLPWSGKSTYALKLQEETWATIISLDIIREQNPELQENVVKTRQVDQIEEAMKQGKDIILDNTHMWYRSYETHLNLAKIYKYEIERVDMYDISWEDYDWYLRTCKIRNNQREWKKRVPESVIDRMFLSNYDDSGAWKMIICDIDWTIANWEHREHLVDSNLPKKDWDWYYALLSNDTPIKPTIDMLNVLDNNNCTIVIVSGRPDRYFWETKEWLDKYNIPYDYILMRNGWDKRPDAQIKQDIYESCIRKYWDRIIWVFDDRKSAKKMWVDNGVFVFDVNQYDKEF